MNEKKNEILATIYVSSLYTSIPYEAGLAGLDLFMSEKEIQFMSLVLSFYALLSLF